MNVANVLQRRVYACKAAGGSRSAQAPRTAVDPATGERVKLERGFVCNHCKVPLTMCALCHLPVKGLQMWCQGCGHGGHLSCMRSWFAGCDSCPAGCLHKCRPEVTGPPEFGCGGCGESSDSGAGAMAVMCQPCTD